MADLMINTRSNRVQATTVVWAYLPAGMILVGKAHGSLTLKEREGEKHRL